MGSKLRAPRNLIPTKKINVTIWLITSKPIYLDKSCIFLKPTNLSLTYEQKQLFLVQQGLNSRNYLTAPKKIRHL